MVWRGATLAFAPSGLIQNGGIFYARRGQYSAAVNGLLRGAV